MLVRRTRATLSPPHFFVMRASAGSEMEIFCILVRRQMRYRRVKIARAESQKAQLARSLFRPTDD